jgi:hypothetical protein
VTAGAIDLECVGIMFAQVSNRERDIRASSNSISMINIGTHRRRPNVAAIDKIRQRGFPELLVCFFFFTFSLRSEFVEMPIAVVIPTTAIDPFPYGSEIFLSNFR